ncbi:glycosyltransferase family 4 protein [Brevibacterium sp.]|uniref:glycosyltransferase family 4 protein n=1 Tax=Brevibacterium sp. TaxID=1701 RepID=UPI0025C42AFE|nr:glycosyltransferase family 4 protein [Brevibacterium sp.]
MSTGPGDEENGAPRSGTAAAPPVLIVDHSSATGGGQLSMARYLQWSRRQCEVELLVFEGGYLAEAAEEAGVRTTVLSAPAGPMRRLVLLRELRRFLRRRPRSVVVANSLNAALSLGMAAPRGHHLVDYLRQEAMPAGLSRLRGRFLEKTGYVRFAEFIANSRWTAGTLPGAVARSRPTAIAYPISGIAQVEALNDAVVGRPGRLSVLSLSRLSPWKGIHLLIEAVRILEAEGVPETFEVTIAGGDHFGEPEYGATLRERAEGLRTPIRFLGHVDDVRSLLADHEVLVCPSVTPEPFGQVNVQGMASGLVTVASDQGGAAEIIESGRSGFLFEPDSPEALAAVLLRLVRSPGELSRVRAAGLERARRFTDDRTLPALDALLLRMQRTAGMR